MNLNWLGLSDGQRPSALASGLVIFLGFLYLLNSRVVDIVVHVRLMPQALFSLELNRLSLYPLLHLSFLHYALNSISLFGPLSFFEKTHGTVYTGVILNLLAVFTALLYCVVGRILYPEVSVVGSSGWCFSFFAYIALKESQINPQQTYFSRFSLPTIYTPVVLLVLTKIICPGSSFWGHFFGMCVGYGMAFKENWVSKLVPPSALITKIETKLDRVINLIPFGIKYYREQEVDRTVGYTSIFPQQGSVLPIHSAEGFQGQGRALGV
ncbi:LAMI_0C02454g1_1 [Lachancea mirantina]|uniref:Rhomboid-type serine protease 2 n=1 Tax=Lachancea mirantina TaxID=1230905 RepID=A0A1G4J0X3_9SACH|nr:LAMI_0C02454g1_1 [Lachancea mirantina]